MRSRVLLVEDSAPMRDAVSRILCAEFDLLGYVDDGHNVLAAAKEHQPDVVVLDISLPGMSGLAALPLLRDSLPGATIVMLTNHVGQEYVEEAFRRGADGYVLKNDAHRALLPAIRRGRIAPGVGDRSSHQPSAAVTLR